MAIELEKILTISARDYCEMIGKKLNYFRPYGVHLKMRIEEPKRSDPENFTDTALELFAQKVPNGSKIVVDYRMCNITTVNTTGSGIYFASGVALIPVDYNPIMSRTMKDIEDWENSFKSD